MSGIDCWLQPLIQALGIVIGALLVVLQLGRQHKNAILQQREQAGQQLRLQIYRDMAQKLVDASGALSNLHAVFFSTVSGMRTRREALEKFRRDFPGLGVSHEKLLETHSRAVGSLLEVIWILESYEIAFPGFEPFKTRLVERSAALSTAFGNLHSRLSPFLTILLSGDEAAKLGTTKVTPEPPDAAGLAELERLFDELSQIGFDLQGYLFDLRVGAQNRLLSGIFPGHAPERKPTDPRVEVLRPLLGTSLKRKGDGG